MTKTKLALYVAWARLRRWLPAWEQACRGPFGVEPWRPQTSVKICPPPAEKE